MFRRAADPVCDLADAELVSSLEAVGAVKTTGESTRGDLPAAAVQPFDREGGTTISLAHYRGGKLEDLDGESAAQEFDRLTDAPVYLAHSPGAAPP